MINRFVSVHTRKIFSEGKVSLPDDYISVIKSLSYDLVYFIPHHELPVVIGGGMDLIDEIDDMVNELSSSDKNKLTSDELSLIYYSQIEIIRPDHDNNIVLSQRLCDHAQLRGAVSFVGAGTKFQLWNPFNFEKYSKNLNNDFINYLTDISK